MPYALGAKCTASTAFAPRKHYATNAATNVTTHDLEKTWLFSRSSYLTHGVVICNDNGANRTEYFYLHVTIRGFLCGSGGTNVS